MLHNAKPFPTHEKFENLTKIEYLNLGTYLIDLPQNFKEKHRTNWKEKMDLMLDKMFEVQDMFKTLRIWPCTDNVDLSVKEVPKPWLEWVPLSAADTLFPKCDLRQLIDNRRLSFTDSEMRYKDQTDHSFIERLVTDLTTFVVDLSESKILDPVLVESQESEISDTDSETRNRSSEFCASCESSEAETQHNFRRKRKFLSPFHKEAESKLKQLMQLPQIRPTISNSNNEDSNVESSPGDHPAWTDQKSVGEPETESEGRSDDIVGYQVSNSVSGKGPSLRTKKSISETRKLTKHQNRDNTRYHSSDETDDFGSGSYLKHREALKIPDDDAAKQNRITSPDQGPIPFKLFLLKLTS